MKRDPLGEPRNPFQVYLLTAGFVLSLPLIVGYTAPTSIEATLPQWLVIGWGLILALGCGSALGGMFWQGDPRTGLLMKRTGLFSVGIASFIYAAAVAANWQRFSDTNLVWSAALTIVSTTGFGGACMVQVQRINRHVRAAITIQEAL